MTQPPTVAGIGCRRLCPMEDVAAAIRRAEALTGTPVASIAAPEWKRDEPGLLAAAAALGLPIRFVSDAELAAAQPRCVTRSLVVQAATGHASIAEAAALAAAGGALILPRIVQGAATCAVAAA